MRLSRGELVLLAILSLGLFLRIYDLSNESLWLDEGYSIKVANLNLSKIAEETSQNDTHPPLYYMILHFWIDLFGDSEFSTRFPSVIFGFFAILMIYKVGSLIFDKETGLLSSLLLGLSVFHIHYSQEVRMYSLLSLLTLFSMYFFIRLFKERSLMTLVGYILFTVLLMYTHVYGLFIIVAQSIYLATLCLLSKEVYKLHFKRWILLQLILIVLFTPWIGFLIVDISGLIQHGFWTPRPSIHSIIASFLEYAGSGYLLLPFLALLSFSIVNYGKIRSNSGWKDSFKSTESYRWNISLSDVNKIYLLLMWLLTPIILPFTISRFLTPIYLTKYTIPASLAFYILVAKGIKNINSKYVKLAIISVIVVLSSRAVWIYYTKIDKDQWREVASYIEKNARHEDLLVFNWYMCENWAFDQYYKRTDLIKKSFSKTPIYEDEENIKTLASTADGYNKVWYVKCLHQGYKDDKELIKQTLNESYDLSDYKKYIGIELYMFEKKSRRI